MALLRTVGARTLNILKRSIATTAVRNGDSRSLVKLKKLQSDYQREDGVPIHLKAGFRDTVLVTTTFVACGVGLLGVLSVIYDQAKPPSWKVPPEGC